MKSGAIGEPRVFNSVFTMQVQEGNIRLRRETGGGTLWDIGIYCINAARYLFRDEPEEVFAYTANNGEKRFREVEEMTSAVLRFPEDRLAVVHLQLRRGRRRRLPGGRHEGRRARRPRLRVRGGAEAA